MGVPSSHVGQLTGADRSGSSNDEAYAYDDNGNRDTANGDTYTTGTNNQLLSDGTYDYTYDDEGNRLSKENIATGEREEYTWDHRNRLTQVTFKNSAGTVVKTVENTYDYQNRWVGKVVDPDGQTGSAALEETNFIYDGNQIVLEFAGDAAADLQHRYLWSNAVDQILADEEVTSLGTTGDILWPLTDNLGTVRDLVNSSGVVQNHIAYDSFGNVVSETNSAVDHLFGFTGRPFDEATELQNNLNRWYDSTVGRWISEDPIGFEGGSNNLSGYVGNSVTNFIDDDGLAKRKPKWRLDTKDHGAPHIQLGDERWDVIDGHPIPHKGHTPNPLTAKQWEEIRKCGLWDKIMKQYPESNLSRVVQELLAEEVREELVRRGLKTLSKTTAREIAEEVIKRSPLAAFFLVARAQEARADAQERGVCFAYTNQIFPAALFEEIFTASAHGISDWIWEDWFSGSKIKERADRRITDQIPNYVK